MPSIVDQVARASTRAQQHAAVNLLRELSRKNPEVGLDRQLQGLRLACEKLGLVLP